MWGEGVFLAPFGLITINEIPLFSSFEHCHCNYPLTKCIFNDQRPFLANFIRFATSLFLLQKVGYCYSAKKLFSKLFEALAHKKIGNIS
jgi:hypothetical protein